LRFIEAAMATEQRVSGVFGDLSGHTVHKGVASLFSIPTKPAAIRPLTAPSAVGATTQKHPGQLSSTSGAKGSTAADEKPFAQMRTVGVRPAARRTAPSREEKAETAEEVAARLRRTVFVGNVPVTTKRLALAKHFRTFGPVESVRIRSAASANLKMAKRAAVITGTLDSNVRDSVNAYVVFDDEASAAKAIEANGAVAFGRHLRIDSAAPSGQSAAANTKRSVFLGNLAFDCSEESLWELFSTCGTIESVRIVRDPQTQQGKGFGYVCFSDKNAVEEALELHERELGGRRLRVFRCTSAASKGGARGGPPGGRPSAGAGELKGVKRWGAPARAAAQPAVHSHRDRKKRAPAPTQHSLQRSKPIGKRSTKKKKAKFGGSAKGLKTTKSARGKGAKGKAGR